MTFYQELQLSSVASKQLIKATEDKKERYRHILIYNFKVYSCNGILCGGSFFIQSFHRE